MSTNTHSNGSGAQATRDSAHDLRLLRKKASQAPRGHKRATELGQLRKALTDLDRHDDADKVTAEIKIEQGIQEALDSERQRGRHGDRRNRERGGHRSGRQGHSPGNRNGNGNREGDKPARKPSAPKADSVANTALNARELKAWAAWRSTKSQEARDEIVAIAGVRKALGGDRNAEFAERIEWDFQVALGSEEKEQATVAGFEQLEKAFAQRVEEAVA